MQTKKIILVTGATGAQGGSVAKALLKEFLSQRRQTNIFPVLQKKKQQNNKY